MEYRYYPARRFLSSPSQIKLLNAGNDYTEDIKKYEQRCKLANLSKGENAEEQSNRARSFGRYVNVLFSTNISFPITVPQRLFYAITLRQLLIRKIVANFKKKALWKLKLSVFKTITIVSFFGVACLLFAISMKAFPFYRRMFRLITETTIIVRLAYAFVPHRWNT